MKKNKILPKNIWITYLLIIIFPSCQINGSLKGLTSYREEVEVANPTIISKELFSCDKIYNKENKLYIISGIQLKECLKASDSALVYIWKPNCRSKECIDLNALQTMCNNKKLKLYVVAEYFDSKKMSLTYELENPILGVDTYFYKSNFTKVYLSNFLKDITGKNFDGNKYSFFLFKSDKCKKVFSNIDDLNGGN